MSQIATFFNDYAMNILLGLGGLLLGALLAGVILLRHFKHELIEVIEQRFNDEKVATILKG